MAILDIWETGEREAGDESSMRGPVFRHARKFDVQVSPGDEEINIATIMADSRIPARNSLCPWDVTSICRSRKLLQDAEEPWLFHVTCDYSNQPLDGERPDQDDDPNPLNRPADVSWDSEEVREALLKDLDGIPIINSAYQLFEQTIEAVRRRRVITIVKNQETYDDATAEGYEECVNSTPFLSKAPLKVLCRRIAAQRAFEGNIYFFRVTYIFVYDKLGWKTRVVDQGTATGLGDVDGNLFWEPIRDKYGTPIVSPVLLNGLGVPATGTPPTPFIKEFRVHNTADFNAIGI